MNNIKKLFLLVLAVFFAFALCACDGADNANNSKNESVNNLNTDTEENKDNESVQKEDELETENVYITSIDSLSADYENYSEANEYVTDLDLDGKDDKITLYTDAELTEDGYARDDGNKWALVVTDGAGGGYYELFNEYVQLGNVYFQVADYFKDGKPVPTITFYETTGAGLNIMNFTYESEKGFLKQIIYDSSKNSDSGINLKYSTIPVY